MQLLKLYSHLHCYVLFWMHPLGPTSVQVHAPNEQFCGIILKWNNIVIGCFTNSRQRQTMWLPKVPPAGKCPNIPVNIKSAVFNIDSYRLKWVPQSTFEIYERVVSPAPFSSNLTLTRVARLRTLTRNEQNWQWYTRSLALKVDELIYQHVSGHRAF